ncbi:hypothetical protein J2X31_003279 [Flavobacterium arsenatis]|uniref:Uncharacterized protein n=1 Tax=Flavobacterium arsenatis TaxID=1484332 RepID=A0ABU1TTQ7_9FLAO|nr:hypothetical protein [Flavobacterium arsenatis]MDR6969252.1 hypothetical protein [Flavobacterium arsenatis]
MIRYSLIAIFLFFCSSKETEKCIDRGIKVEYLGDIDKLIKDGYKCETKFNHFNIEELKNCKILFSDQNYKIVYNGYKTRLLFDKKENLIIAINSITPHFKIIKDRPFSLYILNEKLMPVYAIARFGESNFSVFRIEYLNGKIILSKAIDEESKNINVCNMKYTQIVDLTKKIKYKFSYKKERQTLDNYFYKVPFWTEGLD